MPAKSQAQRGYLASHFGVAWMRRHHYDNKGHLPQHVGDRAVHENGLHHEDYPHHVHKALHNHTTMHEYKGKHHGRKR